MWPKTIPAGTEYTDLGLMMDWLPTFCEIAGIELPSDREYDGESLLKVLKSDGERVGDEFLYYDGGKLECYRKGDWKIKMPFEGFAGASWKHAVASHPLLLINLKDDPGELNNQAENYPEKVEEMLKAMEKYKNSKGKLAPPIFIKSPADNSHYDHVREKYGEEYFSLE
jgi:arylsulfatase A-like enzyme